MGQDIIQYDDAARKAYESALADYYAAAGYGYPVGTPSQDVLDKKKAYEAAQGQADAIRASDFGMGFMEDDPRRLLKAQIGKRPYLATRHQPAAEKTREEYEARR